MPFGRPIVAATFAALFLAVFSLRVFTDFTPVRAKLVRAPLPAAGEVSVDLASNELTRALSPPFAAVWRITHRGPGTGTFRLLFDDHVVCERTFSEPGTTRIDCVAEDHHWMEGGARQAVVVGPTAGWSLDYLELASHHGGSTGVHRLFILPDEARPPRPSIGWRLVAGVLSGALFLIGATPFRHRWTRQLYAVACAIAGIAFLLILAAPWFTPYTVMLSPGGWALWVLVLGLPRVAQTARRVRSFRPSVHQWRLLAAAAIIGIAAAATARIVTRAAVVDYGGNYSGFAHIERERFDRHPILRERDDIRATLLLEDPGGYDAQYAYFALYDPWLRQTPLKAQRDFIDVVPYRYGRSGFIWLTKLASLDRWEYYPYAMVWLVAAGIVGMACVLLAFARHAGVSQAWALLALAIPGLWRSLHYALPEPIAAALLAGAFLCLVRERLRGAAMLFAAALLVRETVLLALVVVCTVLFAQGRRRAALIMLASSVAPYAAWRLYLGFTLYGEWGIAAFFFSPGVHALPLQAMIDVYRSLSDGTYHPEASILARAAFWYPGLMICAFVLAVALARRHPHPITFAAVLYGFLALCLDTNQVWSHIANVERTTYETFVLLAIASVIWGSRDRQLRFVVGFFWVLCVAYLLFGAYDAEFMRYTLFHVEPL